MNGLLLVDKSAGWTSHDVVAKVRSIAKQATGQKVKVGHGGTLDPFATGLLIILVGNYTKRASEFLKLDKTYEVTAKLGEVSTTGDPEGEIKAVRGRKPPATEVRKLLQNFVGENEQIPPAYSALKVSGQRAYKLARAGKPVVLDPRKVTIYSVQLLEYSYPIVKFIAKVSSGTYIRTLVEDIGKALGTSGYCTDLRRTSIGAFSIDQTIRLSELQNLALETVLVSVD